MTLGKWSQRGIQGKFHKALKISSKIKINFYAVEAFGFRNLMVIYSFSYQTTNNQILTWSSKITLKILTWIELKLILISR